MLPSFLGKRKRDHGTDDKQGSDKTSAGLPCGITIQKVNNEVIKPVKVPDEPKNYPAKHISPSTRYPNIFLFGKKKSGKTSAIRHILPKFCNEKTKLVLFVPTLYKDPRWIELCEWAEENHIDVVKRTDNEPDPQTGTRFLSDMVNMMKAKKNKPKEERDPECKEEEQENYVVIFDDMASATQSIDISTLVKRNRHFRIVTMFGIHRKKDIRPEAHPQADVLMIWGGFPLKTLLDIHEENAIDMPAALFIKLHYCITKNKKEHAFMYYDKESGEVRKNLNMRIDIPEAMRTVLPGLDEAIYKHSIKKKRKRQKTD